MQIRFKANPDKIIETITWIAKRLPGSDRYTILKTMFYGDKFHLQKYGRPITGDTYIKMAAGPVASYAYDLIKKDAFLPREILLAANEAFNVDDNQYAAIEAKREPNLDWFSGTDLECLEESASYCCGKDFKTLKRETHSEPAWIAAHMHGQMDFALLIDEDTPNKEALLAYIRETSPCQAV